MKPDTKKILLGLLLFIALGTWLLLAHGGSVSEKKLSHFILYAEFKKADGLMNGAPVRLAGLPVGYVSEQKFSNNFQVRVTLSFDKKLEIPVDSSVTIETDGLLGAKHIELTPGADEEILESGDTLAYTQDVLLLDELLNKLNAYMAKKKETKIEPEEVIDETESD
jgi:phospholipid/cholesterol/gamma-HCH transport system substrate-binding protein